MLNTTLYNGNYLLAYLHAKVNTVYQNVHIFIEDCNIYLAGFAFMFAIATYIYRCLK